MGAPAVAGSIGQPEGVADIHRSRGAFGLVAAEAIAQQYNLPGSGGFTDVSSSINVVTDAGGGNIRVVLADGVQFFAAPGQYQLNPMTSSLQVATDVLLNAYTGAAPVAAQQTQQAFSASQAQAYTTPTVYIQRAALTLGANRTRRRLQWSVATRCSRQQRPTRHHPWLTALSRVNGYVPAYSAGVAGYGRFPSYATYGGARAGCLDLRRHAASAVSSAVPADQDGHAQPAVPAAAAAASGYGVLGIPTPETPQSAAVSQPVAQHCSRSARSAGQHLDQFRQRSFDSEQNT